MSRKYERERLEASLDQITSAYAQGMSLQTIANHYGCSDVMIRRLLVDHGITIRKRKGDKIEVEKSKSGKSEVEKSEAKKHQPAPIPQPVPPRTDFDGLGVNYFRPPGWRLRT